MQYLKEDMAEAEAIVLKAIKNPLAQNQFDMLVDITFNAGPKFVNDPEVQGAICASHHTAVAGLFLCWALDNGVIQDGLLKRAAMRGRIYMQGYTSKNIAWIDKHKI
jgi:GH24 family phage-related lysozyme (muramidase)